MDSVFSSKTRLNNPYELKDNAEIIMKDSWGLKIGAAEWQDMEFCNLSMSREFKVMLLRNFITNGSKETAFDGVSIALMEDQQTILNHLYSKSELEIPDTIDIINIEQATGIEFMQADQKKYLFCEIAFRIITKEPII